MSPSSPHLQHRNMKRNRYQCVSAKTVSARCLSAILALEIVVRRIIWTERQWEREWQKSMQRTHTYTGSASADHVPETLSVSCLPEWQQKWSPSVILTATAKMIIFNSKAASHHLQYTVYMWLEHTEWAWGFGHLRTAKNERYSVLSYFKSLLSLKMLCWQLPRI